MPRDTRLVLACELRRTLHSPFWLVFGVLQPVLWLLLFAPLLRHMLPGGSALELFTPGALVMIVLYGSLYAGFELVAARRSGVVERLEASPVSRTAVILGRVLRDGLAAVVQSAVLVAVAWAMGLHASAPGVLAALLLAGLITLPGAAASYALALRIGDENGLAQTVGFASLPLLLLSGLIVPFSLAPGWLRALGHASPFYYVAEAGRRLFEGRFTDPVVPLAVALSLALTAVTLRWAASALSR